MKEQIFISYRREGGDITAKLICESLKNHGFSVFYDYDSLSGGYFDQRILDAIENCNDFILVLPKNSLDRCTNSDDWVRQEISHAFKYEKNIIPVMLPEFTFPANLPADIENVSRINGVQFIMSYFDGVIDTIIDRLASKPQVHFLPDLQKTRESENLEFLFDNDLNGYTVKVGKCTDTEIFIPRTYQGKSVAGIAEDGFRDCSAITKIVLPDTIKSIGKCAFYQCSLLESVNIPDKVTEIGKWAFYKCTSITNISIPQNVKTIGLRAFTGCESLLNFNVNEHNPFYCSFDNHLYTKDMSMLVSYACARHETTYTVPEGVTDIEDSALAHCNALTSVNLPNTVKNIGDFAFFNCSTLKNITLPAQADALGAYVFKDCTSLKSVTLPIGVQTIGEDAFRNCSSLKKVVLPDTIRSIGETAFYKCTSLENIDIPQKVTDIGKWAFYECSLLKNVSIPQNVCSIGNRAFTKCKSLLHFNVDKNNSFYCSLGGHLYTKDMTTIVAYACARQETVYTVPEGVNTIEDSAFAHCNTLVSINLPSSVKHIGEFAFYNSPSLQNITLPDYAETLGAFVFKDCTSLKSISVPMGIQTIGEDLFRNCSSLKKVILPDSIRSIDEGAFNSCTSLESIDIPKKVTDIGKWAFYECSSLKTVTIPKNVKNIAARAFADCDSIESFHVSIFNKFYRSHNKTLYTKDMTTLVNCAINNKESSFIIPDTVTTIGDCAFSECSSLEIVTIPQSVKAFEDFAFYKCSKLKQIRYNGTMKMWNSISFGKSAFKKISATSVTCTDGAAKI